MPINKISTRDNFPLPEPQIDNENTRDNIMTIISNVDTPREQLEKEGITAERREAFGELSLILESTVTPRGYGFDKILIEIRNIALRKKRNQAEPRPNSLLDENNDLEYQYVMEIDNARNDAWRFYLGIPQKHSTFRISDYRPAKSKEKKYYYALSKKLEAKIFESFLLYHENINIGESEIDTDPYIMGNYTLSMSRDEKGHYISYYDIWDLHPLGKRLELSKILRAGKPFEIYGRIYFDPETRRRIE